MRSGGILESAIVLEIIDSAKETIVTSRFSSTIVVDPVIVSPIVLETPIGKQPTN